MSIFSKSAFFALFPHLGLLFWFRLRRRFIRFFAISLKRGKVPFCRLSQFASIFPFFRILAGMAILRINDIIAAVDDLSKEDTDRHTQRACLKRHFSLIYLTRGKWGKVPISQVNSCSSSVFAFLAFLSFSGIPWNCRIVRLSEICRKWGKMRMPRLFSFLRLRLSLDQRVRENMRFMA